VCFSSTSFSVPSAREWKNQMYKGGHTMKLKNLSQYKSLAAISLCAIAAIISITLNPPSSCGTKVSNKATAQNIKAYINDCHHKNMQPTITAKFGHNLSGMMLRNIDFSGADLTNVDLSYADLTSSNFTQANLANSNLTNALIINAQLQEANLEYTNLTGAFLNYSDATNANLSFARMVETDLSYANLNHATMNRTTLFDPILGFTDFEGSSIKEATTNISRIIQSDTYILPVQTEL